MTPLDPAIVVASRQVMAHHAKSFDRAARFLPQHLRDPVAVLYAFCRMVDDAVDRADSAETARRTLDAVLRELDGQSTPSTIVRGVRSLLNDPLYEAAARALIDGVLSDLGPVALTDREALLRYCYAVAGSVGVLMCAVLGVRDRDALPFAIDLGIAMQLTNICRDVLEDAGNGRVYLPADLLARFGVTPEDIVLGRAPRGPVAAVVREVLALADRYYASADRGMRYLPASARPAILVASRLYRAIGSRLLLSGGDALSGRAFVPSSSRPWLIAGALLTHGVIAVRAFAQPDAHDATLHAALVGCPGVKAGALGGR